jgi:uncharacterized protein (TIGR02118 family)
MRVNILYPRVEGAVFDQQHWLDVHYPLVRNGIWADASSVDFALCRESDPYFASATAIFEDRSVLMAALASEHGEPTSADLKLCYNLAPVILVTEIQRAS